MLVAFTIAVVPILTLFIGLYLGREWGIDTRKKQEEKEQSELFQRYNSKV